MDDSGREEPRSAREAYDAHRGDVARRVLADPASLPQPWNEFRQGGWPLADAVFVYVPEVLRSQISFQLGLRAQGVPFPEILERIAQSGWVYLRQRLSNGELIATGIRDGRTEPSPLHPSVFDSSELDYAVGAVVVGSGRIFGVRVFDAPMVQGATQTTERAAQKSQRGGVDETYDWDEFRRELLRAAFAGELTDRRQIRRHMKEWCSKAWDQQPDESRIRQVLKPLLHESIPERLNDRS